MIGATAAATDTAIKAQGHSVQEWGGGLVAYRLNGTLCRLPTAFVWFPALPAWLPAVPQRISFVLGPVPDGALSDAAESCRPDNRIVPALLNPEINQSRSVLVRAERMLSQCSMARVSQTSTIAGTNTATRTLDSSSAYQSGGFV